MYGVEYDGNGGIRILRIGFSTRQAAQDWKEANDPHNERNSVACCVHFKTFKGLIVWDEK